MKARAPRVSGHGETMVQKGRPKRGCPSRGCGEARFRLPANQILGRVRCRAAPKFGTDLEVRTPDTRLDLLQFNAEHRKSRAH